MATPGSKETDGPADEPEAEAPTEEEKKRDRALDGAISQIEKQFGTGAIMRLGQGTGRRIDAIPTGVLSLDIALGVGGLPRGLMVEIFGPEGSGKTTLALHVLAEAQKQGGKVAFIDAEHAFPAELAETIGIDLDELLVSQPDTGEQALEIADILVRSGTLAAFALDSVAALVPAAELEGDMGDTHVGLQARLMSQAMRKLAGSLARANTCAIFLNQIREKIGVMFGNPETTPGGRALKFWSAVRLEVRRKESLKRGTDIVGYRVGVKVVKSKVAPPFRRTEFDNIYGEGFSREGCLLDLGVDLEILEKSGTWLSFGEQRLGQGRENAREYLAENEALADEIRQTILEKVGMGEPAVEVEAEGETESTE